MIFQRGRASLIALSSFIALLLCGVLYRRTQTIDVRAHEDVKDLLEHLQEVDSDLGKAVLASRYGLVNQYDGLTRDNAELDANRVELRSLLSGTVYRNPSTDRAISQLELAARSLHNDVEQFKTQNSVLRNSLLYLPRGNCLSIIQVLILSV